MTAVAPQPPPPTAQGALAKTPLVHLLVYVFDRRLSGTLFLRVPDGREAAIRFAGGAPVKVRINQDIARFGDVLSAAGLVATEDVKASLEVFKPEENKLHGQVMLEMQLIDQATLLEGLRLQVLFKLGHLFTWPAETAFTYHDGYDALADYGSDDCPEVDPLALVWDAVQRAPSWEHVNASLARVGGAPLRVVVNGQLDRFGFVAEERELAEGLRSTPKRLHEIAKAALAATQVQLVVYTLLITKQLEVVTGDAPMTATVNTPTPSAVESVTVSVAPTSQPPTSLALGRLALQRQARRPSFPVQEVKAPQIGRRDPRASSPGITPVTPEQIAEATRSIECDPKAKGEVSSPPEAAPAPPPLPRLEEVVVNEAAVSGDRIAVAPPASTASGPESREVPPEPSAQVEPAREFAQEGETESSETMKTPNPTDLAAQRQRIVERAKQITKLDYFQMLGVPRGASKEEVQAAYFTLAKIWHPDRLPAGLADVRPQCSTVFAHISEAYQTLTDEKRKQDYMRLVKEGGATPDDQAVIASVLEAAGMFQKAEVFLKRNDIAQAETFCRQASEKDPGQGEYLALLAWIEAMKPENQSSEATLQRIQMLDKAIQTSPKCERAYFYRGMLHKRLQQDDKAIKDFKQSAELNPRNVDAVREVRLHNMRRGSRTSVPPPSGARGSKPPPAPKTNPPGGGAEKSIGGFIGKLFKR